MVLLVLEEVEVILVHEAALVVEAEVAIQELEEAEDKLVVVAEEVEEVHWSLMNLHCQFFDHLP